MQEYAPAWAFLRAVRATEWPKSGPETEATVGLQKGRPRTRSGPPPHCTRSDLLLQPIGLWRGTPNRSDLGLGCRQRIHYQSIALEPLTP